MSVGEADEDESERGLFECWEHFGLACSLIDGIVGG